MLSAKWGYVDKSGDYVIKAQFDEAGPFSDGLAPVKVRRRVTAMADAERKNYERYGHDWGYIDKTGQYVIEPRYKEAGPFSEGVAAVEPGTIVTYIDANGKLIWNPFP